MTTSSRIAGKPVKVYHSPSQGSALAKKIEAATAKKAAKIMDELRAEVVAEVNAIVAAEFVNDRDPKRRKAGRHLLNSFECQVEWDGRSFPIELAVRSGANKAKVAALEWGSEPHEISAVNADRLAFPSNTRGPATGQTSQGTRARAGARPSVRARSQAYGPIGNTAGAAGRLARPETVWHPGNPNPRHFMKRAVEKVLARRFKNAK